MNSHDKCIIDQLEAMPLTDARLAIATKRFGDIDSPNHHLCLSWLSAKDAILRDVREAETLAISKSSKAIAEEALSIAKDANRIASNDLRWAKWAAIIATTAAIAANKDQIFKLIETLAN